MQPAARGAVAREFNQNASFIGRDCMTFSKFLRPQLLAAGIAACLAATTAEASGPQSSLAARADSTNGASATAGRYIVMFAEPSVALRNREAKVSANVAGASSRSMALSPAIPSVVKSNGRLALDMHSTAAASYRARLVSTQAQHKQAIEKTLGRSVNFARTYQSAIDGAVMTLSAAEAAKLRSLPGIRSVTPDRIGYPQDDISTRFIGADMLWRNGRRQPPGPGFTYPTLQSLFADLGAGFGFKGDGITIGAFDTGYNSQSPSFQAADGSGYAVTNPLGSGNYIGDCGVEGISLAGCNDKVFAVYDEYTRSQGNPGVNVEDVAGHGSHTASTSGGNARQVGLLGFGPANISGIAPHANLSVFDIASPTTGYSSTASEVSAVEDAINDGMVDVINMSFGGCGEPDYWTDPAAQGFLAAEQSGIFVALSAGNTRPVTQCAIEAEQSPGTVGNAMPWVTTVAATTPPAGSIAVQLSLTGPGTPPASAQNAGATEGTYDTPLQNALPPSTPIALSPQFDASDTSGSDGCDSYPAGTFNNSIALISRGTCAFAIKVPNAIAAGAIAVVISDNRVEGAFSPTVGPPTVGVPVFSIPQASGLAMQAWLQANNNAGTASLGYPQTRPAGQADVLADFSLIGPVFSPLPFDVIKPDIAAPGVDTLAAVDNAYVDNTGAIQSYGTPNAVDFLSGTSMASPHIAGSAALLAGIHTDWTPSEIRSALMMTATTNVTEADGVTPATPYDAGSGRVQVAVASAASLVLDEDFDNDSVAASDPTQGGSTTSFNLASMQNFSCAGGCSFTRTFTSTQSSDVAYIALATGALANAITITPSNFTVPAGGSVTLTISVNASQLPAGGGYTTGNVLVVPPQSVPLYQTMPVLHLPISVAVPAAQLVTAGNAVNIDLNGKATGSATLDFSNVGGGTVNFGPQTQGAAPLVWINQPDDGGYNGWSSVHYLDPGTGDTDYYVADDFNISGSNVNLSTIAVTGQVYNHSLSSFGAGMGVHWRIYADNNGVPSGSPTSGSSAVWSYDATAASPGVNVANNNISLDLNAAGVATGLAAGTYWLSVYVDLPCNDTGNGCTEAWYWNGSWYGKGNTYTYFDLDSSAWYAGNAEWGSGLSMQITTSVPCAAAPSWLTLTPNGGTGTATAPAATTVTFSAAKAGYAPATSTTGYVCFGTSQTRASDLQQVAGPSQAIQVNANN
jgi:hypothetical protein